MRGKRNHCNGNVVIHNKRFDGSLKIVYEPLIMDGKWVHETGNVPTSLLIKRVIWKSDRSIHTLYPGSRSFRNDKGNANANISIEPNISV